MRGHPYKLYQQFSNCTSRSRSPHSSQNVLSRFSSLHKLKSSLKTIDRCLLCAYRRPFVIGVLMFMIICVWKFYWILLGYYLRGFSAWLSCYLVFLPCFICICRERVEYARQRHQMYRKKQFNGWYEYVDRLTAAAALALSQRWWEPVTRTNCRKTARQFNSSLTFRVESNSTEGNCRWQCDNRIYASDSYVWSLSALHC